MVVFPHMRHTSEHACIQESQTQGAVLCWTHDGPLMDCLGVAPSRRKFETTVFRRHETLQHVQDFQHLPSHQDETHKKNGLGVLLGNSKCDQTKMLTHAFWSLLSGVHGKTAQRPDRHAFVGLDARVSAEPGQVHALMRKGKVRVNVWGKSDHNCLATEVIWTDDSSARMLATSL